MNKEIGKRIKDRRIELKLSMDQLAEATGYTSASRKTVIYHIETRSSDIPLAKLPEFAHALNTNIYYLLGMTDCVNINDDDILCRIEGEYISKPTDDISGTSGTDALPIT